MYKRRALLLTAVLGMASAQAQTPILAPSPVQSAVKDSTLSSAPVSVNTGTFRGPLSVLLSAVAKTAGYDVVYSFNVDALPLIDGTVLPLTGSTASGAGISPYSSAIGKPEELAAKPVAFNFVQRPFNEVWPLLMDVYELQYDVVKVGNGNVIKIGQRPSQLAVPLRYITAKYAEQKALEFFGKPSYSEIPIYDSTGKVVDKVRQFDRYILETGTMRILADVENNRLIAGGTAEESAKIRSFISTIDIPKQAQAVIPNSEVIYMAKGNVADVVAFLKTQYPDLKIAPVGQTGQLVLSGAQSQVEASLKLLNEVDKPVATVSPATETPAQQVYTVKGKQADIVALLGAQFPNLKVTPVGETGQLVITGQKAQLDTALALLGQVDKAVTVVAGPSTVQKVFQLINASAEEVKATLEGTLGRNISTATSSLVPNATLIDPVTGQPYTTGAAATTPISALAANKAAADVATDGAAATASTPEKVTIIADRRTNTLVVRGTQSQVDQIAELIPQLDRAVPQINVQVRIQEITEVASRTLGLDWKVNFGGFSVSAGSGGLGASFDPTRNLVGFNIFPTLQALETQGLSKKVYDGNVTMQSGQRALGSTGASANSSSSAAATVKSGGKLELNIPSQAANVPSIQKTIDYGVVLDFFDPQVAPDGTIALRVRGQVNGLNTKIPETGTVVPNVLDFANSEAQTTVTFKSGQTLLLSGLMGSTDVGNKKGVPVLATIPVIGSLFGAQTTEKRNTQLLVIITGTVVK